MVPGYHEALYRANNHQNPAAKGSTTGFGVFGLQ
jgi:hypothetical protein